MPKLVPITIDEVRQLKGTDRAEAKRLYHDWLQRQRDTDLRIDVNRENRIKRMKVKQVQKKKRLKRKICMDCKKKISKFALRCRSCTSINRIGKPIIVLRGFHKFTNSPATYRRTRRQNSQRK